MTAFAFFGDSIEWKGSGDSEVGINCTTGKIVVRVDPKYYRPTEVEQLLGDPTKARQKLNWNPTVKFGKLVKIMMEANFERAQKQIGNVLTSSV